MYTPNRRPPPKKWIKGAIKRPGKLGGKGFMSKSVDQQHRIMNSCVGRYGYRSCLGSVMLLHNINTGQKRQRMVTLKNWLVREHGGPGSFKRNPSFDPPSKDDGSWDLVPELAEGMLVGNPSTAKLDGAQVEELDRLTNPKNPFYSSYQGTWRGYRTAKTGRPSKAKAKRKARSRVAARSRAGQRIKKQKRKPEPKTTTTKSSNAASIIRTFMRL